MARKPCQATFNRTIEIVRRPDLLKFVVLSGAFCDQRGILITTQAGASSGSDGTGFNRRMQDRADAWNTQQAYMFKHDPKLAALKQRVEQ